MNLDFYNEKVWEWDREKQLETLIRLMRDILNLHASGSVVCPIPGHPNTQKPITSDIKNKQPSSVSSDSTTMEKAKEMNELMASWSLFLKDVTQGYLDVPYHSFSHAVDVTLIVAHFLYQDNLITWCSFDSFHALAMVIAALGHDLLHPGRNNLFQIHAQTEVAVKYKNQSVLERQSIDCLLGLVTKHGLYEKLIPFHRNQTTEPHTLSSTEFNSILSKSTCATPTTDSPAQSSESASKPTSPTHAASTPPSHTKEEFYTLIHDLIISTDMSFHFRLLEEARLIVDNQNQILDVRVAHGYSDMTGLSLQGIAIPPNEKVEPLNAKLTLQDVSGLILTADEKKTIAKLLLHAADISNPVRPFEISKMWSTLVLEEFLHQGDEEKRLHLPVSPNMDRDTAHPIRLSIEFCDFIIFPYFKELEELLPRLSYLIDQCEHNRSQWSQLLAGPSLNKSMSPFYPSLSSHTSSLFSDTDGSAFRKLSISAGTLEFPEHFIQTRSPSRASLSSPKSHSYGSSPLFRTSSAALKSQTTPLSKSLGKATMLGIEEDV